jgi:hypothetical protein
MDHEETLRQIGGRMLGSVGARGFITADESTLVFVISRGHRRVRVFLNGSDLYDVTTVMIRSGRVVLERTDVFCDDLAETVWQAHLER